MNIALFGEQVETLRSDVERAGFRVVNENPDVVISFGGDGTFLRSEARFPTVPKLLIKNSATCTLCTTLPLDHVLKRLSEKAYTVRTILKLQVETAGVVWYALNDVVVRNKNPRHAVRFSLHTNTQTFSNIIGDGVVVATALGATGYFQSITRKTFESGIGVAFNNTAEHLAPLFLPEQETSLTVEIHRGPALVYVDNFEGEAVIHDGEKVLITLSEKPAHLLVF
ncbi:MAG: hypothetical protein AAB439_03750 [Patescibacteria group bacterium]